MRHAILSADYEARFVDTRSSHHLPLSSFVALPQPSRMLTPLGPPLSLNSLKPFGPPQTGMISSLAALHMARPSQSRTSTPAQRSSSTARS